MSASVGVVPGLLLQNVASHPELGECREGFTDLITNCGFKLGGEYEGFYILFRTSSARKRYRQNSQWLINGKKTFNVIAKSVDYDSKDSVIIPYNKYIEFIRQRKQMNSEHSYQNELRMHQTNMKDLRSSCTNKSKTTLIDLLLSAPVIYSMKVEYVLEASKLMKGIVHDPSDMLLRSLYLACQCYELEQFSEVRSHLRSMETLITVERTFNRQFLDQMSYTVRRIGELLEEKEAKREGENDEESLKTFLSLCEEEDVPDMLIIGSIIEVTNFNSFTIQPLGRKMCEVNFDTTEVFNNGKERLTSFPSEDLSKYFVTINFKEKKIFLFERDTTEKRPVRKSVTINSEVEVFSDDEAFSDEDQIFLSQPADQPPVDVEDEDDEKWFQELETFVSENLPTKEKKHHARLVTDLWRERSSWFLSYLNSEIFHNFDFEFPVKFLQSSLSEVLKKEIRESVRDNCVNEVQISNINCEKVIELTSDFFIKKAEEYSEAEREDDPAALRNTIVDVDDYDDDDSDELDNKIPGAAVVNDSTLKLKTENSELLKRISELEITSISNLESYERAQAEKAQEITTLKESLEESEEAFLNLSEAFRKVQTELLNHEAKLKKLEKEKDDEINLLKVQFKRFTETRQQITVVDPHNKNFYLYSEENNLLSLQTVREKWPNVKSLLWVSPVASAPSPFHKVVLKGGFFYPPTIWGWGGVKYYITLH